MKNLNGKLKRFTKIELIINDIFLLKNDKEGFLLES